MAMQPRRWDTLRHQSRQHLPHALPKLAARAEHIALAGHHQTLRAHRTGAR